MAATIRDLIMELVNGSFGYRRAHSPQMRCKNATILPRTIPQTGKALILHEPFEAPLTMIKIVLIIIVSFEPSSQ
jgi:hypothetical protein